MLQRVEDHIGWVSNVGRDLAIEQQPSRFIEWLACTSSS